jgi:hypothetical protein
VISLNKNIWDGRGPDGRLVASGTYVFRTNNRRQGKVIVIH